MNALRNILLIHLPILAMFLLAGCPVDDSTSMARQITQGQSSSRPPAGTTDSGNEVATTPGDGELMPVDEPGDTGDGVGEEPVGEGGSEEEYTGPEVIVEVLEIKAPYPEFDGEGRYDIQVNLLVEEYVEPTVWKIIARDENLETVGTIEHHLKIPYGKPRIFSFPDFWCTSMPVFIECRLSDKESTRAEEGENGDEGDGGRTGGGRTGGSGGGSAGASSRT